MYKTSMLPLILQLRGHAAGANRLLLHTVTFASNGPRMAPITNTALLLLLAAAGAHAAATPAHSNRGPSSSCKAYPGVAGWPSADAWRGLNKTVGGRLLRPTTTLPGGVCHAGQPNYDEARCASVAEQWETSEFHLADPVSIMSNVFTNYTCLPDPSMPCSGAGYPAYVINVTSSADVKAGVDFARRNNVRLNVKSSGHDFLGRSNAPGTLSLWTHHLDSSIQYHADQFTLASGRTFHGNSATFGSAAIMWDIYAALDQHGQTIVGGGSKTVSAGGYVTGGGHSILSPRYGLAADQVIEMEVVTADGKIQKVNQDQNPDLFWALGGGGGSTFGVVTSFTVKTVPSPKMTVAQFVAFTVPDSPILSDLLGYVGAQSPALMDAGLSGYDIISRNFSNPAPGIPGLPSYLAGFQGRLALLDDTADTVAALFKPINDTIHQRWPGGQAGFFYSTTEYASFFAFFAANADTESVGDNKYLVSRLLDRDALTSDEKALGEALLSGTGPGGLSTFFLVGGKGVQEAKPAGGGSNAVNSHWRSAYVHTITAAQGVPFDKAATDRNLKALEEAWAPVRKISPSSGAYLNEASIFEPNFQDSFWGTNYPRLAQIKTKVDPHDVFWCTPCVGNERWHQLENGQLCRV
ncbi:FAD binding domain-containing protein [Beauveria bassiana ARSEF 2860]|uniref:FAD binding domain-containing protein n=1 Tax=Beauveria bassiana (strain ARSEF 2860) TaxID=655819 RepID=J5JJE1_BEAB2|nr:FAD binding domain-containing protein [Beauveria bassiana ARSEF 2860]EJP63436.1 FAD binding domain-containing protein [Beauveria bassiana ARSEF 2860]